MINPTWLNVGSALEFWGEEVTWEILCTDGKWYVWASHSGDENDENNFRFTSTDASLNAAVADISRQLMNNGPAWLCRAITESYL